MRNLVALALTLSMVAGAPAMAAQYYDVNGHWAQSAIENLSDKGVLMGYQDGYYRPNKLVSRAEFTNMLVKALGLNAPYKGSSNGFSDVSSDYLYYGSIQSAMNKGIIEGYDKVNFEPEQPITREEALTMISKVTLGDTPDDEKANEIYRNYGDSYLISDWARTPVAKTIHNDIFKSVYKQSNAVKAGSYVTRGEVAQMLNDLLHHNELARAPKVEIHHEWEKVTDGPDLYPVGRLRPDPKKPTYTTTVATPLSSEFNAVGDKVTLILNEPIFTSNGYKVPRGSKVMGYFDDVENASYLEKARVSLKFDTIMTPDGKEIKINGTVGSRDGYLYNVNRGVVDIQDGSSLEAMEAQVEHEVGSRLAKQRFGNYYLGFANEDKEEFSMLKYNKENIVLVGVGDRLEIKLDGPAKLVR